MKKLYCALDKNHSASYKVNSQLIWVLFCKYSQGVINKYYVPNTAGSSSQIEYKKILPGASRRDESLPSSPYQPISYSISRDNNSHP